MLDALREELVKEIDNLIFDIKRLNENRLGDKTKILVHNHNLKEILLKIRRESTKFVL